MSKTLSIKQMRAMVAAGWRSQFCPVCSSLGVRTEFDSQKNAILAYCGDCGANVDEVPTGLLMRGEWAPQAAKRTQAVFNEEKLLSSELLARDIDLIRKPTNIAGRASEAEVTSLWLELQKKLAEEPCPTCRRKGADGLNCNYFAQEQEFQICCQVCGVIRGVYSVPALITAFSKQRTQDSERRPSVSREAKEPAAPKRGGRFAFIQPIAGGAGGAGGASSDGEDGRRK